MALYLIHSDTGFRQRVRPMSGSGLNFTILRVQALGQGFSSMKLQGEKSEKRTSLWSEGTKRETKVEKKKKQASIS